MTLLGKIFTVLIFIMSIAFMIIAANVYQTHTEWHTKANEFEAQLKTATQVNADNALRQQQLLDDLAIEQAARRASLASLQTKVTQVHQKLAQRERQLTELEKTQSEATVAVKTAQQLLANLTTEVGQLRVDVTDAQQMADSKFAQVVAITDEVNQARRTHSQLTERQLQLANSVAGYEEILRKIGIRFEARTDGTVVSDVNKLPPDVRGFVVDISNSNLIEVSIGADDGLKVGHKLEVYRDNAYLGRVVVRQTDVDRSVAEIIPDFRKGIIRKGDRVATNIN